MALLNYKKKEINAKIVYYGPGLSGKTTNIQHIHGKLRPEHKGKLMTLATQTDRTLFFDFLPVELGEIRGLKTRFQLYTVPGQVFYNATRKLVLKNVDGVVFVADSDPAHVADNIESIRNLAQNLKFHNKDIRSIPLVIQYNKRDLPNALPIEELEKKVNLYGAPHTEASAGMGKGVLETLTTVSKLVLQRLRDTTNVVRVDEEGVSHPTTGKTTQPNQSPAAAEQTVMASPEPVKAAPLDTDPLETAPVETEPVDTEPVETEPVESEPVESDVLEAVDDSVDEEALEIEIEEDFPVDGELPTEDETGLLLDPETPPSPAAPVAQAASAVAAVTKTPHIAFDKVVRAQAADGGVDLTLAFTSGNETVHVDLRLDIRTGKVEKA